MFEAQKDEKLFASTLGTNLDISTLLYIPPLLQMPWEIMILSPGVLILVVMQVAGNMYLV